ncbi:MAG: hypothetical protein KAJ31_05830 [Deltaproteobacteria bacterium]|nr:hypothetical protein [Deltaproteobacteria bacterium]
MKSSKGCFWGIRGDHDHAMDCGINSKCHGELNIISAIPGNGENGFSQARRVVFGRIVNKKNSRHLRLSRVPGF